MKALLIACAFAIAGCTVSATVTPLNPQAQQIGAPMFQFTKQGIDHGPVRITMPDGETLIGSYQVAEGGAFVTAFNSKGGSASAFAMNGGGNFFVSATGPRTIFACQGNVSFGHGGGVCRTPGGAEYQIMF